jgi:hypothetical protein
MAKKLNVADFTETINHALIVSTCSPMIRQGLINALEQALHMSNNYCGYRHLMLCDVPDGELPGIVVQGTIEATPLEVRFDPKFIDHTRVQYFIKG